MHSQKDDMKKICTPGVEKIKEFFQGKIESIVEIGSADGIDADYLAKEYQVDPKSVHIIEPRPNAANEILSRYSQYNVHCLAISNYNSDLVKFNVRSAGGEEGSSLLARHNDPDFYDKEINVKVRTFETFAIENKIKSVDLVKIDVEGCTYEVIQGFGPLIDAVKVFHLEVENTTCWSDQKLKEDILPLFSNLFEIVYSPGTYQEDLILINKKFLS